VLLLLLLLRLVLLLLLSPKHSLMQHGSLLLQSSHRWSEHSALCACGKQAEHAQYAILVTAGYYGSWSLDERGSMMTVTFVVNRCVT
jgi:hypothetical protein